MTNISQTFTYNFKLPMEGIAEILRNRENRAKPKEISFWFPKGIEYDKREGGLKFNAPLIYKCNDYFIIVPNFSFHYNLETQEIKVNNKYFNGIERLNVLETLITSKDQNVRELVKAIDKENPPNQFFFDPALYYKDRAALFTECHTKYPQLTFKDTEMRHDKFYARTSFNIKQYTKPEFFKAIEERLKIFDNLVLPENYYFDFYDRLPSDFKDGETYQEVAKLITYKTPIPISLSLNTWRPNQVEVWLNQEKYERYYHENNDPIRFSTGHFSAMKADLNQTIEKHLQHKQLIDSQQAKLDEIRALIKGKGDIQVNFDLYKYTFQSWGASRIHLTGEYKDEKTFLEEFTKIKKELTKALKNG